MDTFDAGGRYPARIADGTAPAPLPSLQPPLPGPWHADAEPPHVARCQRNSDPPCQRCRPDVRGWRGGGGRWAVGGVGPMYGAGGVVVGGGRWAAGGGRRCPAPDDGADRAGSLRKRPHSADGICGQRWPESGQPLFTTNVRTVAINNQCHGDIRHSQFLPTSLRLC